jgi:hypothetical protein
LPRKLRFVEPDAHSYSFDNPHSSRWKIFLPPLRELSKSHIALSSTVDELTVWQVSNAVVHWSKATPNQHFGVQYKREGGSLTASCRRTIDSFDFFHSNQEK